MGRVARRRDLGAGLSARRRHRAPMSAGVKLRVGLGVAFLLLMGYTGITGGLQQIGQSATLGQRMQPATQLVLGLLGRAAVATLAVPRPRARLMLDPFAAAIS